MTFYRVIHTKAGTKIQLHLKDPITYRFGYTEVAKRRSVDSGGDSCLGSGVSNGVEPTLIDIYPIGRQYVFHFVHRKMYLKRDIVVIEYSYRWRVW
ncbi:hypothetical protein TOC8171_44660 [Pseudomonas syringae]